MSPIERSEYLDGEILCSAEKCCSLCEWDACGPVAHLSGLLSDGSLRRFFRLTKETSLVAVEAMRQFHRHETPLRHDHVEWHRQNVLLASEQAREAMQKLGLADLALGGVLERKACRDLLEQLASSPDAAGNLTLQGAYRYAATVIAARNAER